MSTLVGNVTLSSAIISAYVFAISLLSFLYEFNVSTKQFVHIVCALVQYLQTLCYACFGVLVIYADLRFDKVFTFLIHLCVVVLATQLTVLALVPFDKSGYIGYCRTAVVDRNALNLVNGENTRAYYCFYVILSVG